MTSFVKGMTFTMGGKEYEVLSAGGSDPSSSLVYAPAEDASLKNSHSLRIWKAESRLARGDIMISGYPESEGGTVCLPDAIDPLAQISELKRRIQEIEDRRVTLYRAYDPSAQILLKDNLVRPNKVFDIWAFANTTKARPIQYVKLRGLLLALSSAQGGLEHFLFNISDQLSPTCRIEGDSLNSEGKIRVNLSPEMRTIQGNPPSIISANMDGKVELTMELRLACQFLTGQMIIHANILQAAYIRAINAPGMKTATLAFPEIGEHMIAIEGISVDIYTDADNPRKCVIQ